MYSEVENQIKSSAEAVILPIRDRVAWTGMSRIKTHW